MFATQARFWVQVMRDLRNGVKLKKVQERQYNPLPIEYQLTPYEMLMDDIRSKRYKLRKVMVRACLCFLKTVGTTVMPFCVKMGVPQNGTKGCCREGNLFCETKE